MPSSIPRIVYLANRQIGVSCLQILLEAHLEPIALIIPSGPQAEATAEMKSLVPHLPIIEGKEAFMKSTDRLKELKPEYLLSVHFPLIIPNNILAIPAIGTLNLHPAYLPFNRGWHTPSWAILERTPYGATLHWVDDGVDTGPIALQRLVDVFPHDTAHSLYQRALSAEIALFREAVPHLKNRSLPRVPQQGKGTVHGKADLETMRKIDVERTSGEEVFRKLRALTTNKPEEAAYIEKGGTHYCFRIEVSPDSASP